MLIDDLVKLEVGEGDYWGRVMIALGLLVLYGVLEWTEWRSGNDEMWRNGNWEG